MIGNWLRLHGVEGTLDRNDGGAKLSLLFKKARRRNQYFQVLDAFRRMRGKPWARNVTP